ncbi:thioesterase (plasmid) [Fulvitalea axinellae]|uniref:Thioesterase n=1 Tax=Fulvitalea axinellae TaxID=1182444 RepID=A0AAU9D433_9BACT|nr:thioesterase [Fulvitalea axinellae]
MFKDLQHNEHRHSFRVSYSDTDKMGFVHHSAYLQYYESARWEAFRDWGLCYREIEECGIWMPVTKAELKYLRPAHYDDWLTVVTRIEKAVGPTVVFAYELYKNETILINEAKVTVAFMNEKNKKPCRPPKMILDHISKER